MTETVARTRPRPVVDRRTVLRSAAWTLPAVAVAAPAPAFAASCTQLYYGDYSWDTDYTRTSTTAGGGTMAFSNGRTVPVTLSSTFTNYTAETENLTVTTPVGGTGAGGLTLQHAPNVSGGSGTRTSPYQYYSNNRANAQVLTMTFGSPLYDLSFLLTDIDSAAGDFIDAVEVASSAVYTSSTPAGSTVTTGTGAQGSPFRQPGANTSVDNATGVGGNKRISFAGPVSQVQIRYWNAIATNGVTRGTSPNQAIFISGLTGAVYNTGC